MIVNCDFFRCNLHGPQKIRDYLELMRPFFDAEAVNNPYPVVVKEHTYLTQKT